MKKEGKLSIFLYLYSFIHSFIYIYLFFFNLLINFESGGDRFCLQIMCVFFVFPGTFIFFLILQTNGATDLEYFQIGDSVFLAVANAYNYGPQNINKKQEYFTNSTIYKLDKGRRVFKTFQTIETFR